MPSPFPGMDPYLESPAVWATFHYGLIYNIAALLNRILPSGFRAVTGERVYVMPPDRNVVPDVVLLKRSNVESGPVLPGQGTAVLERVDTPETATVYPSEYHESYVEVRVAKGSEEVLTLIELLSPANKATGRGREEYLRKQQEALESNASLLEIDLLRSGLYTVAVPRPVVAASGEWKYLACLHRASDRYTYDFWRIGFPQRLPYLRVPLTGETADVLLDLQAAFTRTYEEGRYAEALDYEEPPAIALEGEDADWLDALLREKGLRSEAAE